MRSIFQTTRAHRCRRLRRSPVVVLLLLVAATVGAQTDGVNPGDRVRFRTGPTEPFHVAIVARLTADSLSLESCTTCMRLDYARAEVNRLEVFRIRDRGNRTLIGMLVGALTGGVIGYFMSRACTGGAEACELSVLAVPAGALLGGIFGGIAGFLTGYNWQPVDTGP
jgi:hypothetical protein